MITLEVVQLTKSFGSKTVFSDVSFSIQQSSLGIAGSNGSGKSTFLKCLAGLLRPSEGSISWKLDGTETSTNTIRQKMGYAAPYINLYDELTCRENIDLLAKIRHQPITEDKTIQALQKVGLEHVSGQPFGKLSTGQQQRLRLASALFHEPDILLLDEPGSNLDEAGRSLIRQIARSFQSADKLLIVASNNPDELDLCKRVYSIEQESFTPIDLPL